MKRTIIKILCAILVCVMAASTLPIFGYAMEPNSEATKITYIANTTTGVKIVYNKVGNGSTYNIYRKSDDSDYVKISESLSTTFIDKTTQNGTTYTYFVSVDSANTISAFDFNESEDKSTTTEEKSATIEYVAAPKFSLSNTDIGVKVDITPVEGATSYSIKRNPGKGLYVDIGEISASDAPSFVDTSVEDGETYNYIVLTNIDDAFSYYYTSKITAKVAPKMPDDMTTSINYIANTTVGVKLVFNKVDGIDEYNIYRKTEKGNFEAIATTLNSTFIDKTVENGVTYTYSVAIPGYAYSQDTKSIMFVTAPHFTLSNGGLGVKIDIEPVEKATSYGIKRIDPDGKYTLVGQIPASDAPYFVDRTVENNTEYKYFVMAQINSGFSYYYTSKITTNLAPTVTLASVQTGVKVAYAKAPNASRYIIHRRTADSDWTQVGAMKPTSYNYYIDKTAQSGTQYYYSVEIITPAGSSGIDEIGTGVYYLESPTLSLTSKGSGVTINFSQSEGAQRYYILRKLPGTSSYKTIATVSGDASSYFDSAAVAGATYAVRAVNGSAISYMNTATYSPALQFITTMFSFFTSLFA